MLAPFVSDPMEKQSRTELPHSKGTFGVRQPSPLSFSTRPSAWGRPCPHCSCPTEWKNKAVPSYRTPKGTFGVRQLVAAFIFNQAQRVGTSLPALFVSDRMEKQSGTELPHSEAAAGRRASTPVSHRAHSSPVEQTQTMSPHCFPRRHETAVCTPAARRGLIMRWLATRRRGYGSSHYSG